MKIGDKVKLTDRVLRKEYAGRIGTVKKFIKCKNMVEVEFADGKSYKAFLENVQCVGDGLDIVEETVMNENRGLWRGKCLDDGKWKYGYYVHQRPRTGAFGQQITSADYEHHIIIDKRGYSFEIDPSTRGECTGLIDKNKKLIFEGDIVKHYNHKDDPTQFDIGDVFWDEKHARFLRTAKDENTYFLCEDALYPYEVIGNVHDNPELLKGGESNA